MSARGATRSEHLGAGLSPSLPTAGASAGAPGVWPLVRELLRPYSRHLLAAVILNGLHGFAITFQIFVAAWLVDWVLRGEPGPWFLVRAMELLHLPDSVTTRTATLALAYFLISFFGRMLTWHFGYRIFTWVRERMLTRLRERFFQQVNDLCLRFHASRSSGELFSYLFGSPLQAVVDLYEHCTMHVAGAIITLSSAVTLTLGWDHVLTGVLALTSVVKVSFMELSRRRNREIQREYQALAADTSGFVADLLRGRRAVKLHAMEHVALDEFGARARILSARTYESAVQGHIESMKQETVEYVFLALLIAACAWRYTGGHVRLGEVTGFLLAFSQLQEPLAHISGAFFRLGAAQASIERINEVLRAASSVPDPADAGAIVPPAGELELRDVHFAYDTRPVLHGVDLRIPYGQRVALVGPSGGGKTTIAMLLLRMYDPDRGSVSIGGVDLRRCVGASVRRHFGVVPQDPFVFRSTVRENLKVARPDADDALLERACRQANALDFVHQLPGGLGAMLGEGGTTLSGGQRQRLAIARAILADAPFLIFDEATSALDSLSERLVQETLDTLCVGRTTLVIAHRLSTVKRCDRIIVIEAGRVVQVGTYAELVGAPGLFQDLVHGQDLRP